MKRNIVFFVFFLMVLFYSCEQPIGYNEPQQISFSFGEAYDDFCDMYSDYLIITEFYSTLGENFCKLSAFTSGEQVLAAEWVLIEVGNNQWEGYSVYWNFYL